MQRMSGVLHLAAVSEDKGVIRFIQTRTRTSSPRTRMLSKVSKRKRAFRGHYGRRDCPPILGAHGLKLCGAYRASEQQSLVLRTGSPSQRNCVLRTGLPRQHSPGLRIGSPSQRSSILRTGSPIINCRPTLYQNNLVRSLDLYPEIGSDLTCSVDQYANFVWCPKGGSNRSYHKHGTNDEVPKTPTY